MSLGAWLLVGFFAGWLADKVVDRGYGGRGCCANIVVGMLGAFIGGAVMAAFTGQNYRNFIDGFNIETLLVACLGSIILLAVLNLFERGSRRY